MIYYDKYQGHNPVIIGKTKKFDNTIYTFDIETSNYLILDEKIIPADKYDSLSKKEQDNSIKQANMYIWQFGVNDTIYFGRTWEELKKFLKRLNEIVPEKKIVFIHNLSFEFQFLYSVFKMSDILARKSRKVMKATIEEYNIELRCSYMMSNCSLESLANIYQLDVQKKVGDLDYSKLRHSLTNLTKEELDYCKYDCLVVYEYIKKELLIYKKVDNIPLTSTGHVRRELKKIVSKDYPYKQKVRKAINTDPHVYNLLIYAFAGGYTHANWTKAGYVIKDVTSYDFTSSYPYVMTSFLFPSTEFKKCDIKRYEEMSSRFAYLLVLKLTDVNTKYFNTFISMSKCLDIDKGVYDNGRIISAKELTIVITDVDFNILIKSYTFNYEILEAYYSLYDYLPKTFINFVLDKYVLKTEYKGVKEKELEYQLEKAKFNSLYGMSVTNMIKDNVTFNDSWEEIPLSNDEIVEALQLEKKKAFLSFAYGVWVTAWARYNLISNIIKLDDYVIYSDTDSCKLEKGFDNKIIDNYNNSVLKRIKYVSKKLNIPFYKYCPKDIKGKRHLLGVFELDGEYSEFITQGAKKYAYRDEKGIHITVSGVPKKGAKVLNNLDDFQDNLVFKHKDTGKNSKLYNDNQVPTTMVDYLGNIYYVADKTGVCILPDTYTLSKSLEYANLLSDNSSARAIYKEGK